MTKEEFTDRALVEVSDREYASIEEVYMDSDMDKDEFCRMWRKMNASRVEAARRRKAEAEKEEVLRFTLAGMVVRAEACEAFESDAADFFCRTELKALERAGVDVFRYRFLNVKKPVSTICYEIRQFLTSRNA